MSNPKDKYGDVKPQLHLVPASSLVASARVFELGAKKYGPFNWRDDPVKLSVYVAAAKRHLDSAFDGQDLDGESGESHFAHVMSCMAILIDAAHCGTLIDDRPPPGNAHELMAAKKPLEIVEHSLALQMRDRHSA
jgi:hypothetical protein